MRSSIVRLAALPVILLAFARPAAVAPARVLHAPPSDSALAAALASWVSLRASPGREADATAAIARTGGWERGALGSLVARRGSGRPRRVVACPLDLATYIVSRITDDGYLRLHSVGRGGNHPLWHQLNEGQRVTIATRTRDVPGVIGIRNNHFVNAGPPVETIASINDLWVDIGVRSRAEAEQLGVSILDPVLRALGGWTYAGGVAGPGAATRVSCAAVAAAARTTPQAGETIYVLGAQGSLGHLGLNGVLEGLGAVDSITIVDPLLAPADSGGADEAVAARRNPRGLTLPSAGRALVDVAGVRVRFAGTMVETVSLADARALIARVGAAAGVSAADVETNVQAVAAQRPTPSPDPLRDSLSTVSTVLRDLADLYGVSGHEEAVRSAVRERLPAWAKARAVVDSGGSIIVAAGPDRDTTVFVAHMDEVGFDVSRIAGDGTVHLTQRGGLFPTAWEGQPALLHLAPVRNDGARNDACALATEATPGGGSAIRGVFVPRMTARTRWNGELVAWFGMDSSALASCGARPGFAVTAVKRSSRLGATRFTARSMDDRAGSTALILALRELDPAALRHKVIFVWATREEIGLIGSGIVADDLRASVRRVHAVDTFVSSDTPLETGRFAWAPLGKGAVVRGADNSSSSPPEEIDRVLRAARAAGIPMQVGTTNGGTDGTPFTRYGAPNIALSWPGRYSHSPVEVSDLGDIRALARLVAVLARQP
jgi:putative aminopeptidase